MKKLLTGLLGGVALGMLFAPKKGEEMRKKLANSDEKLKDFGSEMLATGKNMSDELKTFLESDEAKDFLKKGKEGLVELFDEGLEGGKKLSKKGKAELASLVQEASTGAKKIAKNVADTTDALLSASPEKREKEDMLSNIKKFFDGKKGE